MQLSAFDYTDKDLEKLLASLYNGEIDPLNLPEDLYLAVAKFVMGGVEKGLSNPAVEFGEVDQKLMDALSENIHLFSAAKTFNFTLEASDSMFDKEGNLLKFEDFKIKATQVFEKYHGEIEHGTIKGGWLEAEYNTALSQAGHVKKWNQIQEQKHILPYLVRNEVNDAAECEICASVNGVCLPVDDSFWDENAGDLHFNCRGIVEQADKAEGESKEWDEDEIKQGLKKGDDAGRTDAFKFNPGKREEIFPTEGKSAHPYFDIPKPYHKFAEQNFGLPIPQIEHPQLTKPQQKELNDLPRSKVHSKAESMQQEKSLTQFVTQKKALVEEYLAHKDMGMVVNTDEARKLFSGYNGLNANAVHEAASALSKSVVKELLNDGVNDRVTMYAGGAGSGKTSAVKQLIPDIKKGTDVIIDGNMSKYDGSFTKINQYLSMGKEIDIIYVYREPLDAWENGVISRMLNNKAEMGRIVPLSTFIENTTGSLNTIQKIIANEVDQIKGVDLKLINNSLGKDKSEFMTQKAFSKIKYPDNMKETLEKRTKQLYKDKVITKEQLEGLLK